MSWRDIRPVALGIARRGDEVLLSRLHDEAADETFYRPIGGGVEFGEQSDQALAREFEEELDLEVVDETHLATLERTFTFNGNEGHEITFLYEVSFAESWPYDREEFQGEETELEETYRAFWKPLDELDDMTVYPEALPSFL
mgnify:CR=1 FL=1